MLFKKVAVLLVVRNEEDILDIFLNKIKKQSYIYTSVYLYNNNSTDNSVQVALSVFPEIKIVNSDQNIGFAKGNNILAEKAVQDGADYLFVLNPDLILDSGCVEEMVKLMETREDIGLAAPIMFNAGTDKINSYGTYVDFHLYKEKWPYRYEEFNKEKIPSLLEVDTVGGGISFLRTSVYKKIGLFEEKYFTYGEEIDLGYRIKKEGLKVCSTSRAKIWRGQNKGKDKKSLLFFRSYYQNRAVFLYLKKHHFYKGVLLKLMLTFKSLPSIIVKDIKKGGPYLLYYHFLGILHGIMNKGGEANIKYE